MSRQLNTISARTRILTLVLVDLVLMSVSLVFFLGRAKAFSGFDDQALVRFFLVLLVCLMLSRMLFSVYIQMVRYAAAGLYLRMVIADAVGGIVFYAVDRLFLPVHLPMAYAVAAVATSLLLTLSSRFAYQWMRKKQFFFVAPDAKSLPSVANKINVAIVGAGELGVLLARELIANRNSRYHPYCFFDNDPRKIGTVIEGMRVLGPDNEVVGMVGKMPIQEIIIALSNINPAEQKKVFATYKQTNCKVLLYDYPLNRLENIEKKRTIREINIEDLLFRSTVSLAETDLADYYRGKTILVTGAGGSIGSELCRQLAVASPRQLVLLDVYENGVYDVQQELCRHYPGLDVRTKIASICDAERLGQTFNKYKPEIVFHAAAHKHVPLMEHNCAEAIVNNVFGTWNVTNAAEQHGVKRFVMVSSDKAVNPTNIMGATKRMCEMIILSRKDSKVTDFVAVRFGNVLGSNGSVVPLFRRQIAEGGPVTVTDKRIIRYFMTIPEAAQLVLRTGSRAEKSEIYVLDMGEPVKILDLAENLISLSGFEPYIDIDIKEIGLRPGEKLYEELLVKKEDCIKTDDARIWIEREQHFTRKQVDLLLDELRRGIAAYGQDDQAVRELMMRVVPTYKSPDDVNCDAEHADEIRSAVSHPYTDIVEPVGIPG
ncbi:MAG: polysaccharide biosynthesis protein [Christensenellales bacterium]|jgi:FlaA1/EpsC-like NDP-sugar epimerase